MERHFVKIAGLFLFLTFFAVSLGFADENEVMALKNQVNELNDKISSLERQMRTMEGHIAAAPGREFLAPGAIQPGEEAPSGLIHTLQDIHMGGYMDVEYNQNLTANTSNNPSALASGTFTPGGNPLRVFDNDQNTFMVNAAVLEFQKTPVETGGVGFRFDIATGENAETVDLATTGSDADEFSIQQAYVDIVAPLKYFEGSEFFGDTIDLRVGRYVTLAGAEVIRSPDNWNISRSLLFGFSIPFTHTGIRGTYMLWNDKITTWWGLNNGWDNVIDNNQMKTVENGISFSPIEDVTLTSSYYLGPENFRQGGHRRFIFSNVAMWNVTDKLSLMGNIDFGNERRVVGLEGFAVENAQWHGYAAYAKYQLTDKWAAAYRFEIFRDDDTYRLGNPGVPVPSPDDHNVWEQTITLERKVYDNLLARLEYRHDKSNDMDVFNGESAQQTLGAQLIYNFA